MPSVVVRICAWIRLTAAFFDTARRRIGRAAPSVPIGDELIYRLKLWPNIPSASKTAGMYRTLSVMSSRPVNRRWILRSSGMQAHEVDLLLRRLVEQGAVDVIDARNYAPDTHPA